MDGDWHSRMEDGLVHVWQRGEFRKHESGRRSGYCVGCHSDGAPTTGMAALDDVPQPPGADARTGAAMKVGIPGWVARQVLVAGLGQADMQPDWANTREGGR